jgi:hypothetical protein
MDTFEVSTYVKSDVATRPFMPYIATSESHFAYCFPPLPHVRLTEIFALLKYPVPRSKAPVLVIAGREHRKLSILALPDQFVGLERPSARNNVFFAPDGLTVAVALRSGVVVYDL